jgi:hypothetical protein
MQYRPLTGRFQIRGRFSASKLLVSDLKKIRLPRPRPELRYASVNQSYDLTAVHGGKAIFQDTKSIAFLQSASDPIFSSCALFWTNLLAFQLPFGEDIIHSFPLFSTTSSSLFLQGIRACLLLNESVYAYCWLILLLLHVDCTLLITVLE